MDIPKPPDHESHLGKDHMALVEFPITLLGDRVPAGINHLVFTDHLKHRGVAIPRKLTITGSTLHGLPTAADNDVIMALIQVTKAANDFTSRVVPYTNHKLISIMGWSNSGKSYARIQKSLKRWMDVTLHYENAWWCPIRKKPVSESFHILDNNTTVAAKPGRKKATGPFDLSTVAWNEVVFSAMQAGYVRTIDIGRYFGFRSEVTRRLYRYLGKLFWNHAVVDIDLDVLAFEKVGIPRGYAPSRIKQSLNPSIVELTLAKFIHEMPPDERYARVGAKAWTVRFVRIGDPRSHSLERSDPPVVNLLIQQKVSPTMARDLADNYPHDLIEETVRRVLEKMEREPGKIQHPPGFIVDAIRKNTTISLPPEKPRAIAAPTPSPITPEKKREMAEERKFEAYLDTLSQEQMDEAQRVAISEATEDQKARLRHKVLGRIESITLRNDYIRRVMYKPTCGRST